MLPGLTGIAGFTSGPFTAEFIGYSEDTTTPAGGDYTFASESFGAVDAQRHVFALVSWAADIDSRSLSSATIGGVAATIHTQVNLSDGVDQSIGCGIVSAPVPSGLTGTIEINLDGTAYMCAIGVCRTTNFTAVADSATDTYSGVSPVSCDVNVDVAANGAVLAVYTGSTLNNGVDWTGATERYDDTESGGDPQNQSRYSGALSAGLSVETNRGVNASQTFAGGPSGGVAVAVSIR